jgi:hypothetical protein
MGLIVSLNQTTTDPYLGFWAGVPRMPAQETRSSPVGTIGIKTGPAALKTLATIPPFEGCYREGK